MPKKENYDLTTLYFPARVMDKLQYIKSYPMTIVEAPSGFGKTTAVRAFFNEFMGESIPVFWHTFLGETVSASWKSLCEIVQRFDSESAERLLELGELNENTMPLITNIIENMECPEDTYIVLDNFQDMRISFIRQLIDALAKHGGEKLHVVIVTQQLSRDGAQILSQNHRVYKLAPQDLTFTKHDAEGYYTQAGLHITPEQLERVYERSDGWIAALYLQMLAFVQTGDFESGDMDALIHTAMWGKLSHEKQSALLTLSIFQSFTLPQAEFMSGVPSTEIETLLRNNPFIRFDRETRNYYMHSILRGYLQNVFENRPEETNKTVYMLAGDWFTKSLSYINAIRFYHLADAADTYEKILSLPLTSLDVADNSVGQDIRPIIFDLIDKTNFETKRRFPQSMINVAFALFFLGEHERLMRMQGEIASVIDSSYVSDTEKDILRGEMELLMSFLEYNDIEKMSVKHRRALDLIGGPTTLISNKSTWTFGSPSILYMYYRESGKMAEALEQMDKCMPHYYQLADGHGTGAEIVMRAEAEFNCGNFDTAEILSHKALFVAESKKQNSIYQCALFLLARIAIMRGDSEALRISLQSLQERAKFNKEDLCRHTLDLCEGFVYVTTGTEGSLAEWLSQGDISQTYLSMMVVPFAHIIYGRALLERGEYLKLLGVSEYFMGVSNIFPNLLPQVYTKIYLAQANTALGKDEEGISLLTQALETALPDKIYMPFAENGEGLRALLPKAAERIADKDGLACIDRLALMFSKSIRKVNAEKPALTQREREVYALVAEGLTNKQIAEQLFISVSTVKANVSRLLDKMGASSRIQLVGKKV